MPTEPSFPAPSRHRCPDCGGSLSGPRCTGCGLALTGDDAHAIWRIDQGLYQLTAQRRLVLARLRERSGPPTAEGARGAAPGGSLPPPPPPPFSPAPWPSTVPAGVAVPTLLLSLGTALIVVAAIVFAAVTWSRLGATVQGLALLALTAGAVLGTRALRRRGLTATAEAVSVVAVALLPVDVHALREVAQVFGLSSGPGGDALVYWCLAIWVVAGASWWLGRFSDTRAPRIIAAVAAQVPVPLYVVAHPVEGSAGQFLCLAQAAAALVVIRRAEQAAKGARRAAIVSAAVTWSFAAISAAGGAFDGGTTGRLAEAAVVAVAAGVAALVAALWADDAQVRSVASGTATGVVLAAAGIAISVAATEGAWWAAMAAACVAVLAVAVRVPRRWGDSPARVAAVVGAVLSLPLVEAALSALAAGLGVADQAWRHDPSTSSLTLAADTVDRIAPGHVVAHLVVVALAVVAVAHRIGAPAVRRALSLLAGVAVALAPTLVDVPVAAVVALMLVAAYAAMFPVAQLGGTRQDPLTLASAAGLATLALAWAAAAPATTIGAVAAIGVLAGWTAALALRDGSGPLAHGAVGATVVAAVAEAGLVAHALGASPVTAWAVAALAGAAASGAVAGLDPAGTRTDGRGRVAVTGELAGGLLHVGAVCAVAGSASSAGSVTLTSIVLAAGAATAAVHALRPGRRLAGVWALVEAVVLVWQRLAVAEVDVPEAYTLPVAVALLAAALVARRLGRTDGLPSWTVHGPSLVAAVAPTLLLALDDPGLVRPLGGLAVGVALLVVGAFTRTRAAVDVGAVTVAVLGLRQLSPVIADLPNWATLGTCGLVLLAVGATFEERRRDLGMLLDRYGQLT